jgi:DNA-binding LacI/PurR family transcriptional regulator
VSRALSEPGRGNPVTRERIWAIARELTFHYDFMNGWDRARQAYLVSHCINGGRQCNGYGVDPKKP